MNEMIVRLIRESASVPLFVRTQRNGATEIMPSERSYEHSFWSRSNDKELFHDFVVDGFNFQFLIPLPKSDISPPPFTI